MMQAILVILSVAAAAMLYRRSSEPLLRFARIPQGIVVPFQISLFVLFSGGLWALLNVLIFGLIEPAQMTRTTDIAVIPTLQPVTLTVVQLPAVEDANPQATADALSTLETNARATHIALATRDAASLATVDALASVEMKSQATFDARSTQEAAVFATSNARATINSRNQATADARATANSRYQATLDARATVDTRHRATANARSTRDARAAATDRARSTATARSRATTNARATDERRQASLPSEIYALLNDWDRIHHYADRTLDGSGLSTVLAGPALEQQRTTLDQLRKTNCYWEFTDLRAPSVLGWRWISSTELVVDVRKHWDGDFYCNRRYNARESFSDPFNIRYRIQLTDQWRITRKETIDDNEVMRGQN